MRIDNTSIPSCSFSASAGVTNNIREQGNNNKRMFQEDEVTDTHNNSSVESKRMRLDDNIMPDPSPVMSSTNSSSSSSVHNAVVNIDDSVENDVGNENDDSVEAEQDIWLVDDSDHYFITSLLLVCV